MDKSERARNTLENIDEESMVKAIWKSGYLLERRVAALLRKEGYKTVTNRGFIDLETNKSREYDVYAYKNVDIFENGSHGIYPTLICECKNYRQPIAFFIQDEKFEPLIDEIRVSGIPSKIWQSNKYISVQEFAKLPKFHHYCKPVVPVSTQCCTFVKNDKINWVAAYGAELFEIYRTITKALEFEIDEDFKNMKQWFEKEAFEKEFIDLSFYYPVVIFQRDIFAAHVENETVTLEKREHIQYNPELFSYYDNEVISYHLDVITEQYLPTYLKLVESEMQKTNQVLSKESKNIKRSLDKIVAECLSLDKKPKTYRQHLEFQF